MPESARSCTQSKISVTDRFPPRARLPGDGRTAAPGPSSAPRPVIHPRRGLPMLAVIADPSLGADRTSQNVSEEEGQPGPRVPGAGPAGDQRPMKACPDCAELVLAQARK